MGRFSLDWNSDSKKNSVYVSDYFSLVALSVALIVCLSVFSFNPQDASSFHFVLTSFMPSGSTFKNLLGGFGANLAEWLIQLLGVGAYIFSTVALVHALQLFQRPRPRSRWKMRLLGYPQLVACLLGFLAAFREEFALMQVGFPVGGWVGQTVVGMMTTTFGASGVRIILGLGLFASLPLCLGVNPVTSVVWMVGRMPWSRLREIAAAVEEKGKKEIAQEPARSEPNRFVVAADDDDASVLTAPGFARETPIEDKRGPHEPIAMRSVQSQPLKNAVVSEKAAHASPTPTQPSAASRMPQRSTGLAAAPDAVSKETYSELLGMLPAGQSAQGDPMAVHKSLESQAHLLATKLGTFGVTGRVVKSQPGPVVNVHEFEPAEGIKVTKVLSLQDDLALGLKAQSVLMAPQPGKSTIGIEVPAPIRETVALRDVMENSSLRELASPLPMALGKNVDGSALVADLSTMPHLLIAGATGSGKSVGINVTLLSLMMARTPEQVRFILVDPKMLELSNYDGIGHLLMPVVTDPSKAAGALRWAIDEMERRYQLMRKAAVRNIAAFNTEVQANRLTVEQLEGETPAALPYIVVVIDELCDLMMTAPKDIEDSIQRLAQKARAAGIHLILATQRPSVDVITGVIKANLPCRISFQVASKHDSRTIIESVGAEKLLGRGDMLFLPPGTNRIVRGHGAYIGDREINQLSERLRQLYPTRYDNETMAAVQRNAQQISQKNDGAKGDKIDELGVDGNQLDENDLYDRAVDFAVSSGTVSTSSLQRNFRIGYNRAARLMDRMVKDGLVGPSDVAGKPRQVLSGERGMHS
ncbi:MAG: DNA translocase FtsK [Betaproteobacteria bacterium]|nr:DNA translocase FtsK [Betaproteobacteria bacterium]